MSLRQTLDEVTHVPVRGHAQRSPHGRVLAGVARGLDQLFPPLALDDDGVSWREIAAEEPLGSFEEPKPHLG